MLIRLLILITGLVSFVYFLSPSIFSSENLEAGDVLGIEQRNAQFNKPIINTVLLAFCISEGEPPKNLNDLYSGYLREERNLDLDNLYEYRVLDSKSCEYALKVK